MSDAYHRLTNVVILGYTNIDSTYVFFFKSWLCVLGVRLRMARPAQIQVATAQRRARAVASEHQQHHGRGRRAASLHAGGAPRAHRPRAGGAHPSR